jgi:hypothetical protein
MLAQIEWERENLSTNVMDLVNTRPNLHRTICGCLVQAMCQWTGVNVGAYFGPTIYGQSSSFKRRVRELTNFSQARFRRSDYSYDQRIVRCLGSHHNLHLHCESTAPPTIVKRG